MKTNNKKRHRHSWYTFGLYSAFLRLDITHFKHYSKLLYLYYYRLFARLFRILARLIKIVLFLCALPFVYLYVLLTRLINNLTTTSLKSDGNKAFTPIYELERKKDGKKIIFYGCIHVGNISYYQELQRRLDAQDGLVLYEGLDRKKIVEKDATATNKKRGNYWNQVSKLTGGVGQGQGIVYRDHWISNDLGPDKMNKLANIVFGQKPISALVTGFDELDYELRLTIQWFVSTLIINMYTLRPIYYLFPEKNKSKWRERVKKYWILDKRNSHAITQLESYLHEHQTIGLLWGAAHFSGMYQLLKKQGFEKTKTEWVVALSKPTTVFKIIRLIFRPQDDSRSKGLVLYQKF